MKTATLRTMQFLVVITGLLALAFTTVVTAAPAAQAYSDDYSGGGTWQPPGGGPTGGSGTYCDPQGNERRSNTNSIIVGNSPRCWGGSYQNGSGFVSTGYEVWRFYRDTDGNVTWARGRINTTNWGTQGGLNRIVIGSPLPFDYEWACAHAIAWQWALPVQCRSAGAYTRFIGGLTGQPFRQPQQSRVQVVGWPFGNYSFYNTNVNSNNDWSTMTIGGLVPGGFSTGSGIANMLNLQTTRSEDPIASALSEYPESAGAVNTNISQIFHKWAYPFGFTEAAGFLNSTLTSSSNQVTYQTNPGNGLAGDLIPMGSSLDLFGTKRSADNTINAAPVYGTCYIELESRVKPYSYQGRTYWGVISNDDYNATPYWSWRTRQGERYKNQSATNNGLGQFSWDQRAHVFNVFRHIINNDWGGPQTYNRLNPNANTRPFRPDYAWPNSPADRPASANWAATKANCVAGTANVEAVPSEEEARFPSTPTPTGQVQLPKAAVANGKLSTSQIGANISFPTLPSGVRIDPVRSYAQFTVTLPDGYRNCPTNTNTTTNCDFSFTSGTTVTKNGNVLSVRVPITSTRSSTSMNMNFYKATPPGTVVKVKLDRIHTEFDVTGVQESDPIDVCLVGGGYGSTTTGSGECIRVIESVDLSPTKRVVSDVTPSGESASGEFPVISATPFSR